jgi:hypothetical protein
MTDCFVYDSGRVFIRQNGREFAPTALDEVVSCRTGDRGHGCHLGLINGSSISIQWGNGNYCSNRGADLTGSYSTCSDAEVAIFSPDGEWHNFGSDTVKGWQTVDEVISLIRHYSRNNIVAE